MTTPPGLCLPEFSKPFIIECDASRRGIGAILMQSGQPLAYLSQGLKGKSFESIYLREGVIGLGYGHQEVETLSVRAYF